MDKKEQATKTLTLLVSGYPQSKQAYRISLILNPPNRLPSFPTARHECDRESLPRRKKITDISFFDSGVTTLRIEMERALRIPHLVYSYLS